MRLFALLCGFTLALATCHVPQEGVVIERVPLWSDAGLCAANTTATESLNLGVLDIQGSTGYSLPVVIQNNLLTQTATKQANGVDNTELVLHTAVITLSSPSHPDLFKQLKSQSEKLVRYSVSLPSMAFSSGQKLSLVIPAIPKTTVDALRKLMAKSATDEDVSMDMAVALRTSRTNAAGKATTIYGRTFVFPVRVCVGCLVQCGACDAQACEVGLEVGFEGGICNNAQDFPVVPYGCAPEGESSSGSSG